MRDVLERSLRLIHGKARIRRRIRRLGQALDRRRLYRRRGNVVQFAVGDARRHGAGRKDSCPDKIPSIEIYGRWRYLAGQYFIWIFQSAA